MRLYKWIVISIISIILLQSYISLNFTLSRWYSVCSSLTGIFSTTWFNFVSFFPTQTHKREGVIAQSFSERRRVEETTPRGLNSITRSMRALGRRCIKNLIRRLSSLRFNVNASSPPPRGRSGEWKVSIPAGRTFSGVSHRTCNYRSLSARRSGRGGSRRKQFRDDFPFFHLHLVDTRDKTG